MVFNLFLKSLFVFPNRTIIFPIKFSKQNFIRRAFMFSETGTQNLLIFFGKSRNRKINSKFFWHHVIPHNAVSHDRLRKSKWNLKQ